MLLFLADWMLLRNLMSVSLGFANFRPSQSQILEERNSHFLHVTLMVHGQFRCGLNFCKICVRPLSITVVMYPASTVSLTSTNKVHAGYILLLPHHLVT